MSEVTPEKRRYIRTEVAMVIALVLFGGTAVYTTLSGWSAHDVIVALLPVLGVVVYLDGWRKR